MKVTLPAGIDDGNKMRMAGEGEDGINGGRPGDLYLIIHVREDERFVRQDNDLIHELSIGFPQAALGDEIKIKTFFGTEKVKIPPETQNGTVIKVKGKGFKNVKGWGKGDFLIVIRVNTPRRLSKREKELIKELRKIELKKQNPNPKDQELTQ
jgi:molecular chaperone DnaJ